MAGPPLIGVAASWEQARWRNWDIAADMLPRTYAEAVQRAGGVALLLPADEDAGAVDAILERIDGLILAGGCDIEETTRDRFEARLAERALAKDLPLLGICRGIEVLNLQGGGTLIEHVPDVVGSDRHLLEPGVFATHDVDVDSALLGTDRLTVQSHHHQGLDRIAEGWEVVGRAAEDGLVEAIERRDRRFALGVLWHPEEDPGSPVIPALVGAASAA